jgi:hypothetical protein
MDDGASIVMLRELLANLRPQRRMCLLAECDPKVAGGKTEISRVRAADQFNQRKGRPRSTMA